MLILIINGCDLGEALIYTIVRTYILYKIIVKFFFSSTLPLVVDNPHVALSLLSIVNPARVPQDQELILIIILL